MIFEILLMMAFFILYVLMIAGGVYIVKDSKSGNK